MQSKSPVYKLGLSRLLKVIRRTRALRAREKWSREELRAHQQRELDRLRQFAYRNSPFYQRFHKGLEDKPLGDLPVLTKQTLMDSWDDVVTDRSLQLKEVLGFLENVRGLEAYLGRFYAFATGGTTGLKGVTVYSEDEFLNFFALTARASGWTEMKFKLTDRPRMATVQSHQPWHVAGAAGFIKLPFIKVLALDSAEPLPDLARKLDAFQPHVLGGYATNVQLLALEQLAGRLKISPKTVLSTAETLKKEARAAIDQAWGAQPFEAYGATETAEAASECAEHRGMHVYEDVLILEVVDNDNHPVPPGSFGDKVLVTVLWNHTLPLIRYELSDHVKLATKPCPCGRPFQLIAEVEGREEQVIYLAGKAGDEVRIEPDIFFEAMVLLPIDGWQVVQESDHAIAFLILGPHPQFDESAFLKRMAEELTKRGASAPKLRVEYITELRRTKIGKQVTIQARHKKA
jgi:phenylacetate-coenzyme A ligase PaaK-like adenylate-forming protein